MSLPWSINAFFSTAINSSNTIASGVYQNVSFLVNGNSEFKSDTICQHLGIKRVPNAAYSLDVSGNVNISGTITGGGAHTWSGKQTFTGGIDASASQVIDFGVNLPTSTATPTTGTQLITKTYGDTTYQAIGSYGTIGGTNNWTGTNTFNTNFPTSTLAPIQSSTTATEILNRQTNDNRYGQKLSGATNAWASTNTFNTSLPTSTVTPTTATQLITKTYADTKYPIIDNTLNSLYGGTGAYRSGTGTAQYSIALGTQALNLVTTGGFNQAYGTQALQFCTTGTQNIAFGVNSLRFITSGNYNMAVGTNSLSAGNFSNCVGVGQSALVANTATGAANNTGIGAFVMNNSVGSTNCTAIGYNAGTVGIVNGNNNTFIGSGTSASGDYSNSTAIGYNSQVTASNQIMLGTSAQTTVMLGGITASAAQTINFGTNAPTMSGANITLIPTSAITGYGTGFATTAGANSFGALNTFTGGITASGAQTITFGTNAPTMSGANITLIPTSAITGYGSGFATTAGANSFGALNTFTGGITATAAQTINFGTNAPTMSGANIGSGTIPTASVVGSSGFATQAGANSFSALNTFTGGITASGAQAITFGTNAPTMSGANITLIPTSAITGYGTGFATTAGANSFGALNTFTGGITATASQAITFGTNAPTMSGANITLIPTSAITGYGTGFATTAGANSFGALNTFTGGITATAAQTINFGTNAPTMSGANIGSGTIPTASVVGSSGFATQAGANSFSALNTFTGGITASGAQAITFGTNAPTMSGANITLIPTSAITGYGTGFATTAGANSFGALNTFTGGITATASQAITFGTNAPTMSGANITLIPTSAITGYGTGFATTAGANSFSALNTFAAGISATASQAITFGTNAPTMSGANITLIPTSAITGYGTGFATTAGANSFSALNTFAAGISATASQAITFGSNAPTMSGANITLIPTSAITGYGTGFATTAGANSFGALNTFTGGITATATQAITFGSNAPTMSGANIGSATIPYASLAASIYLNKQTNLNYISGGTSSITTGDYNTSYQAGSIYITSGYSNSFFGTSAGNKLKNDANANTAIGAYCMGQNSTGGGNASYNTGVGRFSLTVITTGGYNGAFGEESLLRLTTGSNNNFVGYTAGAAIVTGENNSGIGHNCASGIIDSSNCTFLGANTNNGVAGQSYTTCVGAGTSCSTSNTIQLGSNSEMVAVSGLLKVKSQYLNSCSTPLTLGATWDLSGSSPWYEIYPLNFYAGAGTVDLPTPDATTTGMRMTFRRLGTSGLATITTNLGVYPTNSSTTTTVLFGVNTWTVTIYCANLTSSTYSWFFV